MQVADEELAREENPAVAGQETHVVKQEAYRQPDHGAGQETQQWNEIYGCAFEDTLADECTQYDSPVGP